MVASKFRPSSTQEFKRMTEPQILEISKLNAAGQKTLLDLNNAHQIETSYLSPTDWQSLVDMAYCATSFDMAALLIAFDQDAAYDNANFHWFRARYDRFVYVDRIVVSEKLRGAGAAQALYQQLFERAAAANLNWVVCEINVDPPNPGSDAFHLKMGFEEVGRAILTDRQKTVRYLAKSIPHASA